MEDSKPGLFGQIKNFVLEVVHETKKVTWPARKDIYGSAVVLIFVGVLLTLTLSIIDFSFGEVLTLMLTGGRK